jgi:hypothetical protein
MAGIQNNSECDTSEPSVCLRATKDSLGWRVVLHLHAPDGSCTSLDGPTRYPTREECTEAGKELGHTLQLVMGIWKNGSFPPANPDTN